MKSFSIFILKTLTTLLFALVLIAPSLLLSDQSYNPENEIKKLIHDAVQNKEIHGASFKLFKPDGTEFTYSYGNTNCVTEDASGKRKNVECSFTPESRILIASSTKWISSSLMLSAMDEFSREGKSDSFNLNTPVGEYLSSCFGKYNQNNDILKTVRLRHLLSFTAGLVVPNNRGELTGDHSCVGNPRFTLRDCACEILKNSVPYFAGAGKTYNYGDGYHTVAAAMLEAAMVELDDPPANINSALDKFINKKIQAKWTYGDLNLKNPSLAASIASTLDEYARFIAALPANILNEDTFKIQHSDFFERNTKIINSPWINDSGDNSYYLPHHYGLNNFRECYVRPPMIINGEVSKLPKGPRDFNKDGYMSPDINCAGDFTFGHGGKHGFAPWIDYNRGYRAILALQEIDDNRDGADYREFKHTFPLIIRAHINALLNRPPEIPQVDAFSIKLRKSWATKFSIQDPDRDEIEIPKNQKSWPDGFSAEITPREAGRRDQEITLTWLRPIVSGVYNFNLEAKDVSLSAKSISIPLSITVEDGPDADKDGVNDFDDCAKNDPSKWKFLFYHYTDRNGDGKYRSEFGRLCTNGSLPSGYKDSL